MKMMKEEQRASGANGIRPLANRKAWKPAAKTAYEQKTGRRCGIGLVEGRRDGRV
jgi:hypothetical protein